jgi:carbamoylphosphate synthase large subunit
MDNNNIKTVFKEYIQPTEMKVISKIIEQMNVDKYVKKLDSITFTNIFIYAQLKQLPSLKTISF